MSAHGPDAGAHRAACTAELHPVKVGLRSMAFMFESCMMLGVTKWGLQTCEKVQEEYNKHSWEPLKPMFKNPSRITVLKFINKNRSNFNTPCSFYLAFLSLQNRTYNT